VCVCVPCGKFPGCSKINLAVTPTHNSEVIMQHYNSVMCLSKIQRASDGVLLFDNEVTGDRHLSNQLLTPCLMIMIVFLFTGDDKSVHRYDWRAEAQCIRHQQDHRA
jgi:hypothetical protein